MPTDHILALLVAERDRLNAAIAALQGGVKRRGRPAKVEQTAGPAEKAARKQRTPAQRKAQALRMKKYWAAKKKASS